VAGFIHSGGAAWIEMSLDMLIFHFQNRRFFAFDVDPRPVNDRFPLETTEF
jgi:hypothetical protein